jgi:hypothetical protein
MLEEAETAPAIASDWSVRQNIHRGTTFAWVLVAAANGTPWLKCKGPVVGLLHVDSFRAEGYGLLSASLLLYLNMLAECFHASIPKIAIHTDSEESSPTRIAKSRNQR